MRASQFVARLGTRLGVDPVIIGIIIFFVVHMLIRIFGTSDFSVDDTETAVHTQVFQLYYSLRNPPLFDWLFFGLSQLIGVNLITMQILKTVLLIGGGVFLFLAARPAFRHRAALDAGILAYGATAFYGWDVFQQFSHTITLVFSLGFTFWAFMRVVRLARTIDYVVLGFGLGLGLLSKYLFGLYFVALVVASLRSPNYRQAILSWRMVLVFVVGLVVVSPLLFGLSDAIFDMFSTVGGRVAASGRSNDLGSLAYILLLSAEFWLPFTVFLWVGLYRFPAAGEASSQINNSTSAAAVDESFYPLVRDATLFMFIAIFASAAILGTGVSGGRYLVSILSLLPLAVFAGVDRWQNFPALAVHNFWRGTMMVIVGVAVIRFAIFLFISPPFCLPRCKIFVDYTPVVEKLVAVDGKQNVILSSEVHLASNLLRLVPNARIVMDTYTGGSDLGIADPADRNCYFIWFKNYRGGRDWTIEAAMERGLRRPPTSSDLAAVGSVEYVAVDWQTTLLWEWGPDTIVGIATLDSDARICDGGRIPGLSAPPSGNSMQ